VIGIIRLTAGEYSYKHPLISARTAPAAPTTSRLDPNGGVMRPPTDEDIENYDEIM
jgi:hypothetical protein